MNSIDNMRAEIRHLRYVEQVYRTESEMPIMHNNTRLTTDTNSHVAHLQREIARVCDEAAVELEQDIASILEAGAA